jgi:type IV pilus assembly protein PilW
MPFVVANGGGAFTLQQKDCSAANPAGVRKIVQRVYYVSTCNVCTGAGADTTPTLKMAEYVNGAMTVTPLVEGIEDVELDYGIDYDDPTSTPALVGNGSPACYTSDPANPPATEIAASICPASTPAYDWSSASRNWANVVAVRIHVLARSTDPTVGWADARTYDMGLAEGSVGPFGDAYKRHVYSTLARLNNISGQRE